MPTFIPTTLLPFVLIAAAVVLLLVRERLTGQGPVIQESRPLPRFHTIDCRGAFDVTVVCQQEPHVAVATSADLLRRVTTTVEDGILHIRLHRWGWWSPSRPVALDVTVPNLVQITAAGATQVTIANVANEQLRIQGDGASHCRLSGETGHLLVSGDGAARFDATDLMADHVSLHLRGHCQANVHATARMDVEGHGAIQVAYTGDPAVSQRLAGAGSVKRV